MSKITSPLKQGTKGAAVGDLHAALAALGYSVPEKERAAKRFGAGTTREVKGFQAARKLKASGTVDDATATALNRLLVEHGRMDPSGQPLPPTHTVQGMVRDALGRGMGHRPVTVYELQLRQRLELQRGTTFENGYYELRYRQPHHGNKPKPQFSLVVVVTREDGTEWASEPTFDVGPDDGKEPQWINFFEGPGEYEKSAYEKTLDAIGAQARGVDLTDLVEDDTRREISYLAGRTKLPTQEIMLVVVAHHLAKRTGLPPEGFYGLFRQGLPRNLPASLLRRTYKFTMLDPLVDRLLDGLVSRTDDVLRRALEQALKARQVPLSLQGNVEDFLKKLHAVRVEHTLDGANAVGKASLRDILSTTKLKDNHVRLVGELYALHGGPTRAFANALQEKRKALGSKVVDDVLLTLDLGVKIKNHAPLLKTLKADLAGKRIPHPALLATWDRSDWEKAIKKSATREEKGYPANTDGETETERVRTYATVLTDRFQAAYPTLALAGQVDRAEIPVLRHKKKIVKFLSDNPDVDLRTVRLDSYVRENPRSPIAGRDATPVLSELRVMQRTLQLAPAAPLAATLLTREYTSAQRIYTTGLSLFVKDLVAQGVAQKAAEKVFAKAELTYAMVLARLLEYSLDFNRILPKAIQPPVTPQLLEEKNVEQDYPTLRGLFGSLDYCACEHCQSVYSPSAYLVDVLHFLKERHDRHGHPVKDALFRRRGDLGDIDLTCANTTTPIPYVDLVNEILEDAVAPPAPRQLPGSARSHLVDGVASPELRDILAQKGILVADSATVGTVKAGERWTIRDRSGHYKVDAAGGALRIRLSRQTIGTASELSAHPLYVNGDAYAILAEAVHPTTLPFDLATEEARAYLAQLGIARHDLMRAFQNRSGALPLPSAASAAAEAFGICAAEARLVTTPNEQRLAEFWGVADPVRDLATVGTFLRQAGFLDHPGKEYRLLLELLASSFVNPSKDETGKATTDHSDIERGQEPCDTMQQTITNLSAPKLDRIHRFLRLWRRTGWSLMELDRLIQSPGVGNGALDEACLANLWSFRTLQTRWKLSVDELLSFHADIDAEWRRIGDEIVDPFHARLFLDKKVVAPLDPAFEPSAMAKHPSEDLDAHRATILAALQLSEEDYRLLAAKTDGKLTLRNLSVLLRHALLARALGLRVRDLLQLLDLTGIMPFNGLEDADRLARAHERIGESPFSLEDLTYLLTPGLESPLGLSAEVAEQHLDQVRRDMEKAGAPERPVEAETVIASLAPLLQMDSKEARAVLLHVERDGAPLVHAFVDPARVANLLERDEQGDYKHPISDKPRFGALFDALHLMHKAQLLSSRLGLDAEGLEWLIRNPARYRLDGDGAPQTGLAFGSLPVAAGEPAVPFRSWLALVRLEAFNGRFPEREGVSLRSILDGVAARGATSATLDGLAAWTEWDREDLLEVHRALGLRHPQSGAAPHDYENVETYYRIAECIRLSRRAGLDPRTLKALRAPATSLEQASVVKQAVKAKYPEATWASVSKGLQDVIREKKRASLVAYLVANPPDLDPADPSRGKAWTDANGLSAHFLVDAETSPCQPTSRIKQAAASVQLFVQRCFLNLERDVVVDTLPDDGDDAHLDRDWLQWKWMRVYRVWEANRKVFLYPENWIEPELRDDKSPFFRQLETDLQQNEVTDEYVEETFLNYLARLDEVARLEVVGTCDHAAADGRTVTHVIARTRGAPHIYYHRERLSGDVSSWTPWKKLDIEIQGDHVLPVVHNRKLHVFWLTFSERPEQRQAVGTPQESSSPPAEPRKFLEIQLSWTLLKHGKWTPKTTSPAKLIHPWARPAHSYSMHAYQADDGALRLNLFVSTSREFNDARVLDAQGNPTAQLKNPGFEAHSEAARPWHSSTFVFDGNVLRVLFVAFSNWYAKIQADYGEDGRAIRPIVSDRQRELPAGMKYRSNALTNHVDVPRDDLNVIVVDRSLSNSEQVLENIPTPFQVVTPSDSLSFDPARPFFFQDAHRSYYVVPETIYRSEYDDYGKAVQVPDHVVYRFRDFYHPYTTLFIREVSRRGIPGLLNRKIQDSPALLEPGGATGFDRVYLHRTSASPSPTSPRAKADNPAEIVDFTFDGAYAQYNWELFFHAPFMIALRLAQNQRFEESLRWFHYIFDPTNPSPEAPPRKYWITGPFHLQSGEEYRNQKIDRLLGNVNAGIKSYVQQVRAWRDNPFKPHAIARLRNVAYQWAVVMKYLDTVIAWADQLFRRDTIESVNEATQLYILAAELLGPRPVQVPALEPSAPKSFNDLEPDLDEFGNAMEDYENHVRVGSVSTPSDETAEPLPRPHSFFFCIPPNEKLFGYWDTIADRLFKIRHCMNIEGRVRTLPLFEPPIDPAVLVRAAAAGVDLGSVLIETSDSPPRLRFAVAVQKAHEFCNDVKALGAALLSALEKKDAEAISLLRSSHEIKVLEATKAVREHQIAEALESAAALEKSRDVAEERRAYYAGLVTANITAGEVIGLGLSTASLALDAGIAAGYIMAGGLRFIPQFLVGASGFGGSPHATGETGGVQASGAAENAVKTMSAISHALDKGASMAFRLAEYGRRLEEWKYQQRLAERDIAQIGRQIEAAKLRAEVARKELRTVEVQRDNAEKVDEYMRSKYTNEELYGWMVGQVSAVYFQAYQLAYDMALRAQASFRWELGDDAASFVQFGYWDGLKKGLLAGERLTLDLRRMEADYMERNARDLELTKPISLRQVDPVALQRLKATGRTTFKLPSLLFDMDYPGHYFRRIKSVSLSIPCVVGPYTTVNCTLTLAGSKYRIDPTGGYEPSTDDKTREVLAATTAIATSTAREDAGLFELSFRDERYLPFEGAGAESEWMLEMPKEFNQFDFATIPDVILHMRYTAKADGGLGTAATPLVQQKQKASGHQVVDLKRDFPGAWHRFLNPPEGENQELELRLGREHFPFYVRGGTIKVTSIQVVGDLADAGGYELSVAPASSTPIPLAQDPAQDPNLGTLHYGKRESTSGYDVGYWVLKLRKKTTPASDWRSLAEGEVRELVLILGFKVVP